MRRQNPRAFRIAVVWDSSPMRSQQVLIGLYRRAEAQPELSLRRYDCLTPDFEKSIVKHLRAWRPHGVVVRLESPETVLRIRKGLPGIPIVSACRMPADRVDTMVLGDGREVVRVSRAHLKDQGVETLALWAPGTPEGAASLTRLFHEELPDGSALACPLDTEQLRATPKGKGLRIVGDWLRALPKPVGVVTFAGYGAPYLSRVCRKLGLCVPAEIQLIGCDDADACLECTPHLTTVIPSGERIGEAAMEAMLGHLVPKGRRPPVELRVGGCTLIARGSTGPVARASLSVARATDIIQTHATKGLTADSLIQMTHQGRSTFYQQFREATGSTPARQLRERRISAACRLLVSSDLAITLVAEKCGFSSANYFSQVFRRETGFSPGEYRREKS
jgi:LacI family transcriptional regulator